MTGGMKPGGLALANACTGVFDPDGQQYLQQWWAYQTERKTEGYYRGLFAETGLLISRPNDVAAVFAKSSEHISPEIFGEVTPTVGKGLDASHSESQRRFSNRSASNKACPYSPMKPMLVP